MDREEARRFLQSLVDDDENDEVFTRPSKRQLRKFSGNKDVCNGTVSFTDSSNIRSEASCSVSPGASTSSSQSDPFSSNNDTSINDSQTECEEDLPSVPYYKLYRFATRMDKLMIFIGSILALISGFCAPVTNYAFGVFTKAMVEKGTNTTCSSSNESIFAGASPFMKTVETFVIYNCICGLLQFILCYLMVVCFNIVAENQAHKFRLQYFESLLRQDIGWFDLNSKKDFSSRITDDIIKIQEAMSEKLGLCIFTVTNFTLLLAQSYYYGWKLSVLLTFALPPIFLITYLQNKWSNLLTAKEQEAYSTVASIAQEVFTNIRTVTAFNGQKQEIQRYDSYLKKTKKFSYRKGAILGLGHGLGWLFCFLNYSLAFFYGTRLIIESRERGDLIYGPDIIVVVFFGILVASYNIGSASDYFESFGEGAGAARAIFSVLDRKPDVVATTSAGKKPLQKARGHIEFVEVHFSYPSRPSVKVLNGFTASIRPGEAIAIVGHSGVGKSTCIQLLQRFYDICDGEIRIDGVDIRYLDPAWLRSQIGVVSQEPILFNMTIYENIKLGKENCTCREVELAARLAFAHDFIMNLPQGYSTIVGARGTQLSGGQKQRIGIARSLLRNPSILLLDEATSALDMQSEAVVQAAMEGARLGRSTIIVAHRLSTIKAADKIITMENGKVVEVGNHAELMEKKGVYYNLIKGQSHLDLDVDFSPLLSPEIFSSPMSSPIFLLEDSINVNIIDKKSSRMELEDEERKGERELLIHHFRLGRMLKMGINEWPYLLASAVCTIIKGFNVPLYSIVFGNFISIFANYDNAYVSEHGNFYSLLYIVIAVVTGTSAFAQRYFAVIAADKFTLRLRRLLFKTVLGQEISFFDEQENTVGRLCARLSNDVASMQGAIGNRLIGLVQAVTVISLSLAMSFYFLPKMGSIACIFVPMAIASTMIEGKVLELANIAEKKAIESAANIAVEALENIRTVQSLGVEKKFMELYKASLDESHKINIRRAHLRAFAYAFVYALPCLAYSICLFYGAFLVETECAHISDVFKVGEALIFGSMAAATALAYAPDYSKGKVAAARVFKLLDNSPSIDHFSPHGKVLTHSRGKVEFDSVDFSYKSRPTTKALNQISICIKPGHQIGLVGPTGSGKSTFAQLLLRFYDPQLGRIAFDDAYLKLVNVHDLRSHLGIVEQEPILFDRSIAENIAYGDNSTECSMGDIIKVARIANIHDFIASLPSGYATKVGSLGSQLSGGQKQRVAIARALIRNPKVWILDEAASALDSKSEKLVQEALEKAQDGRTSISIAHRLTSIKDCSHIFVLKDGKLVEHGTHEQLLSNFNQYYAMWSAQYRRSGHSSTVEYLQ